MSSSGRLSQRLRRAYATLAVVLFTTGILAAGYYAVRQRLRPAEYQPGEANADVTASLARRLPADAPRPRFIDVTREAGLDGYLTFAGQRSSQLPEDMGPGAAWGDFDNDGDDDLFVVSAGAALGRTEAARAPSLLFENEGGRFVPVADFPAPRILGMGAAWGDVDGDGWLDLVVTGYNSLQLFRNAHGRFVRDNRFPNPPGFWAGAAWGDYDADGDLDLYVCGYVQYIETDANRARASDHYGTSVPYSLNPASYKPQANLLLRNDGSGRFTDVAAKLGVDNPAGRSLSALWHDFDEDGWLDLYVANDISDNVLYRNDGRRFVDVSHPAWVADHRGAMGLAAGDWNRDGDDDLFITHWVAQENALYDSLLSDAAEFPVTVPAASGGAAPPAEPLLRFVDNADAVGLGQIALRAIGWGAEFVDIDADGWLDLVVANGSTFETDATPKQLQPQAPFLFWNRRGEHFHDLAPLDGAFVAPRVGRGLAVSDYDGDGDMDVLLVRHGEGVQLLRNDMPQGHWLKLALRRVTRQGGLVPAWGARVVIRAGAATIERTLSSASYLSQSTSVLHVGLGGSAAVESIEVRWNGGQATSLGRLDANQTWAIVEGAPTPRRLDTPSPVPQDPRERERQFWTLQRAGMDALKRDGDVDRAADLLRQALALDASHEDTRYYLGNALAARGDAEGALAQFDRLRRQSPESHRAHARWGTLRADTAAGETHLTAAEAALSQAHALNPEETGVLLALGEINVLQGDLAGADVRLSAVSRSNPRSAHALFLRGYVRWKAGDANGATERLQQCRAALGPDWKPAGTTAEGDVVRRAHAEHTPLARFLDEWDGRVEARAAYASLDRHLRAYRRRLSPPVTP